MIRLGAIALLSLISPVVAFADDWTDRAFPVKKHDFGTVAVAAKTQFEFPIRNPFREPMHIRDVRASCGCTTPIVKDDYIEPGQTGTLVARFNTDTFRGRKGATLTVVIDKPVYSEVRLRVDGYIRSDMVFHPGAVEFGKIDQGEAKEVSTKVMYAGRNDWKVIEVRSNRPWLLPSIDEVKRTGGRVTYQIDVKVREDAPAGFFQDELIVMTNDRTMPRVPLRVSGEVDSALTISPQAIALGSVKPGESVRQKMILLGEKPFRVKSIEAEGWKVEVDLSGEAKKTHILLPEFTSATDQVGPRKSSLVITTVGEESVTAKALLTADIRDR